MDSKLIKQIEDILNKAGVENYCDWILKNDEYYAIFQKESWRKMYFLHSLTKNYIGANVRRYRTPDKIKLKYGIDGYGYVNYENAKNHYPFFIPLKNGLLNGKYTIPEKRNFFIDIARGR